MQNFILLSTFLLWFKEYAISMNSFKKKYNFIYLSYLFINPSLVIADQCPSPEIIKERKISRAYEWTIDERRSLDDVLSVEKLYSVRIKNKGEFIACYYSGSKNLLRLDGTSLKKECVVKKKSGNWDFSENGEQVCKEENLNLCHYEIHCEESSENND
jgi:hypothetical protein